MFSRFVGDKSNLLLVATLLSAGLVLFFVCGCDSDDDGSWPLTGMSAAAGWGPGIEPTGQVVSVSGCMYTIAPVSLTVVNWEYDGAGTLDLSHWGAGFNCCPDPQCSVDIDERTITVIERDSGSCFCLCLVEAEYQVTGLPPGKYLLKFDEAVPIGDGEPLECEILLKGGGSSGKCVAERCDYPWGCLPTGELISCELGASPCPAPYRGCLSWDYNDNGALNLVHRNEYGSCCFVNEPAVYFNVLGSTITITEDIQMGWLAVMVNVEVDMLISNLPRNQFTIVLNRFMELETVEFTVNLLDEPSGEIGFD
jgi:hypothetical protein